MYHSTTAVDLAGIRIDRIVQNASGSYRRSFEIDDVCLVYILPTGGPAAMGCLDEPLSLHSFQQLGSTFALPPNHRLHVLSPPSSGREMIVLRYGREVWQEMPGASDVIAGTGLDRWSNIHAPDLYRTLDRMSLELQKIDPSQPALLTGLAFVALGELLRHLSEERAEARGQLAPWQSRRIAARLARPGPPPTVEELAGLCRISTRHLMRVFKAATGETVMHCIERIRFERARAQLRQGSPIKRISAEAGYASQGSFSTAFRRHCGVGPTEYRKRYLAR